MAGPGGGSRGGGGGRSGGFRGGSFRSTYHGGGRHPGGGWHYRSSRGGGCLSQLIVPIILLFSLGGNMLSSLWSGIASIPSGGAIQYNEQVYQDYADGRYAEIFGGSSAYEDNLMISVLVAEDHYSYYYIAWVGDHIATDINHMLGGKGTALGMAMDSCISQTSYKYSLDSNLAQVMEILTEEAESLNLTDSFTCTENHAQVNSVLINDSNLDLTESTVNNALAAFTGKTGIPAVIVVEDMADVFDRTFPVASVVLLLALAALVIFYIFRAIRYLRRGGEEEHPYHSFDDQY